MRRCREKVRMAGALRVFSILLGLIWGSLWQAGCHTPTEGIPITKGPGIQCQDIPAPLGFTFDERRSWSYDRFSFPPLNLRSCWLYYYGDRPVNELVEWYKEQMPLHEWTHMRTHGRDRKVVEFENATEIAEIEICRVPDPTRTTLITEIRADIDPK